MTTSIQLPEKHKQLIIWTLLCIMPLIGMAVDLISPSLPAIATGLLIPVSTAKNVIAVYLFGYALGNFFTGFLTDAWGRQRLIRIGLFVFVMVSLLPVFFANITILLLARFLQGISLGAVAVLLRSIFADIFPSEKLVRMGTLTGTMWGLGPIIGPIIGGYLQFYIGWQAGFCFFAVAAACAFIAVYRWIPETHTNHHPLRLSTITHNLMAVLRDQKFMSMTLLMGLVYSLIITFNTAGPFLIQTKFNYSPIFFGHLAFYLGLAFLVTTFICRYLLKKYTVSRLFFITIHLFFTCALLAVIASYFFRDSISLVVITSLLMFSASGFIFPLSMGVGLSMFRQIAGTATATMFLINILITSLTAFLVSFVTIQNAIPLMWLYFLLFSVVVIVYWMMISPSNSTNVEKQAT
jgi:Bcr/CflA subfamily drug resistance transporter